MLIKLGIVMSNSVFMNGDPFWANACVGENGFIDYFTYAEGYSKASNLLLNSALQDRGKNVDSYIYPICFNMRHSIELRIKGAISKLRELATIKSTTLNSFTLTKSHNILDIWLYYQNSSELLDYRFKSINTLLNQTIIDIGKIDPTGQVFRYPFDDGDQKHLVKVGIINCVVLRAKFSDLENNLNKLDRLTNLLIEEYKLGTFTSKFSRSQIFNLAKVLPQYENWYKDLNKREICSQYNFSNNDLSRVLDIIKRNYETSGFIGLELELIHLQNDFIIELCNIWITNINPDFRTLYSKDIISISISDTANNSGLFNELIEEQKLKKEAYKQLSENLNIDIVADLWALFYLSRDGENYSEMYFQLFKHFKKEILAENNFLKSFDHIFSKGSFLEEIIRSLYFLQKNELAETIVSSLNLRSIFDFVNKARDRSLFRRWEYLNYNI